MMRDWLPLLLIYCLSDGLCRPFCDCGCHDIGGCGEWGRGCEPCGCYYSRGCDGRMRRICDRCSRPIVGGSCGCFDSCRCGGFDDFLRYLW